jgi:thioredoxin 1
MKYNVNSIPSLILFKNGNEIDRTIGISSKEKYENFVNTALNSQSL